MIQWSGFQQDEAAAQLASLMALYPSTTRFFLNLWTWGYEEIYKAIARKFGTKVWLHVPTS